MGPAALTSHRPHCRAHRAANSEVKIAFIMALKPRDLLTHQKPSDH